MHSDRLWDARRVLMEKTHRRYNTHSLVVSMIALETKRKMLKGNVSFNQPRGQKQKCWLK
jgi:hypothetical protein